MNKMTILETEAAVLVETGQPLQFKQLILPELQDGQLLIKIAYSGLCHTQLGEVRGKRGTDRFLPHTLGHEGSGIVLAVGEHVTKAQPGDHVVLSWLKGSGTDIGALTYQSVSGIINSGAISTFMKHTVTCESRITVIPQDVPLQEAALLGCAIPTGCGIIKNEAQVSKGDSVAIFGVGGIGLSALLGAKMMAAATIIAVDINDDKLLKATSLGATHVINPTNQNVLEEIDKLTNQRGVDYAIEAAGKADVMALAFQSVRNSGGLCIIAGNPAPGEHITIDPFDLIRGKKIIGSWGGETIPDRDIPFYIKSYINDKLPLNELVSTIYKLEDLNTALDDLEKGEIIRALIDMSL